MSTQLSQLGLAAILAIALVAGVDLLGNSLERPAHDGRFYVDMARNGIAANPQLAAPFAYRPAVPLAVGAVSQATGIPVVTVFSALSRIAAALGLIAIFGLARFASANFRVAMLVMSAMALSYFHVKFPLFFWSLVDVEAAPLMLLAMWALLTRRFAVCLALGCGGLFFKEFLAIPLLLMLAIMAREFARETSGRKPLGWLALTLGAMIVCLALPRALLPIHSSMQFFDPLHKPETWSLLWQAPLDGGRIANLLFSLAAYWLPTLMLLTRERLQWLKKQLLEQGTGMELVGCFVLVLVLAVYGGTNLNVFVTYTLPIQVIVLAKLGSRDVAGFEWALVLIALFSFSRIAFDIPSPIGGGEAFDRYVDFYGGWSSRLTGRTLVRVLELASAIGIAFTARALLARPPRRRSAPS